MKKIYSLIAILSITASSFSQVVISQVYGGGGNNGGIYTHDFIELHNNGTTSQSLNGWSVQYTSAAGPAVAPNNNWFMTPLPNVILLPGQYFLIQQGAGAGNGVALPTPDVNGITAASTGSDGSAITTGFAMSGSNGKVLLSNSTTPETTANPSGANIVDKVGYGTTPTGFEGTGPTGTALTNTTAAIRNNNGCTDTNSNPSDFTAGTPAARNTATAVNICTLGTNENTIAGFSISPNPVNNGVFYITTDANAEKAVTIYDILGKQVLKTVTSENAVNVSNLHSGVYMVQVTEGGKTATKKLVIR
ncbi:MAG: T9SS type A sorting domain-containing protein [Bacteroidota bacterium]